MLRNQHVASKINTTDQTVHIYACWEFITSFFLNRIHFSTRKCMFDTFTKKCTRNYTAAYTIAVVNNYRKFEEIIFTNNKDISV